MKIIKKHTFTYILIKIDKKYLNGYSGIFIFIFFYSAHFVGFGLLFLAFSEKEVHKKFIQKVF